VRASGADGTWGTELASSSTHLDTVIASVRVPERGPGIALMPVRKRQSTIAGKKSAAKRGKSHRGAQKRTRGIVRNCTVFSKVCAKLIYLYKTTDYEPALGGQVTRIVT
jgi:hypothetical protein